MDTKAEMGRMVAELLALRRESWKLSFDEEKLEKLGSPCSADALARLAQALGKPLPPSYRAFLELHDGWQSFRGVAKLLAAGDRADPWVGKTLRNLSDLFDEFEEANPIKDGAFVIMLGEGGNWSLFLEPNKVAADGEMNLVLFDWTQLEERFESFSSFISQEIARLRIVIDHDKNG